MLNPNDSLNQNKNFEYLKDQNLLVFYGIRGSHLYGTDTPDSDTDYHGIFMHPEKEWLKMHSPCDEYSDNKNDVVIFEMKKYMNLALSANPTVIEMMFTPSKFIIFDSQVSKALFNHRSIFITKKCFYSFSGYARDQIKKARGKNKKVMNEPKLFHKPGIEKLKELLLQDKISPEWVEIRFSKPFLAYLLKDQHLPLSQKNSFAEMNIYLEDEDIAKLLPPKRDAFCYVIMTDESLLKKDISLSKIMPARPIPLLETNVDLRHFNCSSVEHVGHMYRLYYYGEKANGIFKGGEVVCSSIPVNDEQKLFKGMLIFSSSEYESAKSEWRSFWEWMANRNENRWFSETKNVNFEYDRKNMQHTVRLLLSAENIPLNREPLVSFSGDKLKFLRKIRNGEYSYDYLMGFANEKILSVEQDFEKSSLPDACNVRMASCIYDELVELNRKR
jgi:predicted nucleotidyltransferase